MANPLLMQNENEVEIKIKQVHGVDSQVDGQVSGSAMKKRKVSNGLNGDYVGITPVNGDGHSIDDHEKLYKFQSNPLESNIDYISLQSSLDLLRDRANKLERDVQQLADFKQKIWETSDLKQLPSIIKNNSDYLNEITYKGVTIKNPKINWKQNFGLNIDALNIDENYEEINEKYEIIKRDQLF
ncbi:Pre-mRNA-splicing ATP-dependent RNA helicase prp28 [Wickerhamomyces ciferrii]|uniref:Pre-mRNA-splicing ATP-dependent RNA helicase prp28 n=1 Tax=Wickerhamomyces ciferrii (strain ATCC 14091 / BCRC 22168 / CBS 111 / JCM 3599 / NBRC 0793 / NRRL Y-1031 F-60-10) TaxID=1206466 RepID=K0KLY8_WICCF|nr:Pre-mRNA-splicing ATP-dependent RNA helicase prp28 [Wickerhamomyces ciferrii]CCH42369.1 Pre-mRNA-splicing ATP-dependent RNA helicase prp28 [Wickerhamomyces ciferrii]